MRRILFLLVLSIVYPVSVFPSEGRYDSTAEVLLDVKLQEDQITRVYIRPLFATKLEMPDQIIRAIPGDQTESLIKTVITKDRMGIYIIPVAETGITNLLVDTNNSKFNYEIIIGDERLLDYRLGSAKASSESRSPEVLSQEYLLSLVNNYDVLKNTNVISDGVAETKNMMSIIRRDGIVLYTHRILLHKKPHYLCFDLTVENATEFSQAIDLDSIRVHIKDHQFKPRHSVVYSRDLLPNSQTKLVLVLEHSFISIHNDFYFSMTIGGKNYVFQ